MEGTVKVSLKDFDKLRKSKKELDNLRKLYESSTVISEACKYHRNSLGKKLSELHRPIDKVMPEREFNNWHLFIALLNPTQ